MLNVDVAVAKVCKYAMPESGDTVEVVERPRGGLSLVMADGQRSGRSAKMISNLAVRKAITLLAEGVRDGAVARAAHDYLRTARNGQVSAELVLISVDLETRTLVITRNSRVPVLLCEAGAWQVLDADAVAVG
ncbi:MAG TPA: serine/threonine-protein phosphatase, partial [Anaerolineae bacterium]